MAKIKKEIAEGFASGELYQVLCDIADDLAAINAELTTPVTLKTTK